MEAFNVAVARGKRGLLEIRKREGVLQRSNYSNSKGIVEEKVNRKNCSVSARVVARRASFRQREYFGQFRVPLVGALFAKLSSIRADRRRIFARIREFPGGGRRGERGRWALMLVIRGSRRSLARVRSFCAYVATSRRRLPAGRLRHSRLRRGSSVHSSFSQEGAAAPHRTYLLEIEPN